MRSKLILATLLAVSLGGCTSTAQLVASTATSLSSSTPNQASTLAEATLAADTLVKLTKVAVDTNTLDAGELTQLQALRAGVRSALDALYKANQANQSLSFAAFNAAIDAYNAYTTVKGITH